jgi:hypothetical protein
MKKLGLAVAAAAILLAGSVGYGVAQVAQKPRLDRRNSAAKREMLPASVTAAE